MKKIPERPFKSNIAELYSLVMPLKSSDIKTSMINQLRVTYKNLKDTPCYGSNFDTWEFEGLKNEFLVAVSAICKAAGDKMPSEAQERIMGFYTAVQNYPNSRSLGPNKKKDYVVGENNQLYATGSFPEAVVSDVSLPKNGREKNNSIKQ